MDTTGRVLVLELLSDFDYGTVPAWFGGISFVLAFVIFFRDRKVADRSQVDQLGVWFSTGVREESEEQFGMIVWKIKNASNLPVKVVELRYTVSTTWAKMAPEGGGFRTVKGRSTSSGSNYIGTIPPEETREERDYPWVEPQRPEEGVRLYGPYPVTCVLEYVLIRDNAGRRWQAQRRGGGPAKRVRWYSLLSMRQKDPFHPWTRRFDLFLGYWRRFKLKGLRPSNLRYLLTTKPDPTINEEDLH